MRLDPKRTEEEDVLCRSRCAQRASRATGVSKVHGFGREDVGERWCLAAERAIKEKIRISQIESSGQWIASSGTKFGVSYAVGVTGNIAHSCDCDAANHNDKVCKHRAAFYLHIGALAIVDTETGEIIDEA